MKFEELSLGGAYVIHPEPFEDERGTFARVFCRSEFEQRGLNPSIAQCNVSRNRSKGTLRGLHYQAAPHAEVKLVRCTRGAVFDVLVDVRKGSSTYLQWEGVELSDRVGQAVYVPEGFAHGYQALMDDAEVLYMVSEFYAPGAERGIRWDDPLLGIAWPLRNPIVSAKDSSHPALEP